MGKNRARFISQVEDCLQCCGLSMAGREGGMGKRMDGHTASLLLVLQDENLNRYPAGISTPFVQSSLAGGCFFLGGTGKVPQLQVFVFLAFPASCGWAALVPCDCRLWIPGAVRADL